MFLNYSDYLLTLFIIPLCTTLISLTVLVGSLILFFKKFVQGENQKKQRVGILLLKSIPFTIAIPLALLFVIMSYTHLKLGIPLLFEKEESAILFVGEITNMEVDDLTRTTYDSAGNSIRAQYVYFDNLRLYCSNVGELSEGDIVLVRYLPKSNVILNIQISDGEPVSPPVQQPSFEYAFDNAIRMIIFVILFISTYIINFIRHILVRTDKKGEKWDHNTIELKYKDGPLLMGIRCAIGVFLLLTVPNSYLLATPIICIAILGQIKSGSKCPLNYDENGIAITAVNGKVFTYAWEQVISVTQEEHFNLGHCIRVTYCLESGRHESILFSKFYHIGTERFLKVSSQHLHH